MQLSRMKVSAQTGTTTT